MNKKLINDAKKAIRDYDSLNSDRYYRHLESGRPHQVNVKRYNDDIDIEGIIKNTLKYKKYFYTSNQNKLIKKYSHDILETFTDEYLQDTWYSWLENECEQLKYELSEIITFKHLNMSDFHFRGRSGGYACFDDNVDQYASELDEWISDTELYPIDEYKNDILEYTKDINDAIQEISDAKEFIKKFNNSLNFHYEVFYRINELIEELEAEEKSLSTDTYRFKTDITAINNRLLARLDQFKANNQLKTSIIRNAKSIKKLIQKDN